MAEKTKKRPFLWIIVGLSAIGLLGFGTGGLNGTITSLGSAGDKDIPIASYQTALNDQLRAFEAQTGQRITFQQAREIGLDQAVLQQIVTRRTLDNEAAELGVSVGDERVRDEVLRIPAFRDLSGNFDREAYGLSLDRIGQTEAQFEASLRDELSRTLLQGAVVGGVPTPDVYAETLVTYVSETRDATYAFVSADQLEEPLPGPTDADLETYYEANADAFLTPELRDITYVWLTPEMIQDELEIDEDTLRATYEERIAEFQQPERRLVERLVYADQAAADAAKASVDAGEADFDALVADRGLDLNDVDMGDVTESQLGAAGEAVFAAAPGDVVGPFNSSLGPALFRMNAILAAENVDFEAARGDLRAELANARARRVIDQSREGINDLIAGGATLEDLTNQTDLEIGTIAYSEDVQDGPAAYDSFRAAASTVESGAFLEIGELADGGIFALRLDGVTPPATPPLDVIRDDVAAAWQAAQTQEAIVARAEELAAQISPLTAFETLGLTPVETDNLLRRSFVEGTVPEFNTALFEMDVAEVRVIDNLDGAIILRLDAVAAPDPESAEVQAQIDALGAQAAQGIAQDIFDAYADAVQARTDITINQVVLDQLATQYQ